MSGRDIIPVLRQIFSKQGLVTLACEVFWSAGQSVGHEARMQLLRTLLRRVPYWRRGHLLLGREAFLEKDFSCAYASAQAVLRLGSCQNLARRNLDYDGRFLLARCFLSTGQPQRAREELEKLLAESEDLPEIHAVREELAACYLLEGSTERASQLLSSIPDKDRSAAAHMVLAHAIRKQ